MPKLHSKLAVTSLVLSHLLGCGGQDPEEGTPREPSPDAGTSHDSRPPTEVGLVDTGTGPTPDSGTPPEVGTKWYPGHYITVLSPHHGSGTKPWDRPAFKAALADPNVTGFMLMADWAELETAKDVYDFALFDELLDRVGAKGKKLIFKVQDRSFTGEPNGNMPKYIVDMGCTFGLPDQNTPDPNDSKGLALQWWTPKCVDRLIALYEAFGKRYDGDKRMFMAILGDGESCLNGTYKPGQDWGDPSFSLEGYVTQAIRTAGEAKKSWKHTVVGMPFNCWTVDHAGKVAKAIDEIGGVAFTHPDTIPGRMFGVDGVSTKTEIAYHGKVPTLPQFQQTAFPEHTAGLEAQIFGWATDKIGASIAIWGNASRWAKSNYVEDYVLPFLAKAPAFPASNVACPTRLAPCID